MSKRSKPVAIPQSDLMTRRTRDHILIPVAVALLLVIIAVTTAVASLVYIPLAAGDTGSCAADLCDYGIRRLITENRTIMRELSSIAEKNEDVINSVSRTRSGSRLTTWCFLAACFARRAQHPSSRS